MPWLLQKAGLKPSSDMAAFLLYQLPHQGGQAREAKVLLKHRVWVGVEVLVVDWSRFLQGGCTCQDHTTGASLPDPEKECGHRSHGFSPFLYHK